MSVRPDASPGRPHESLDAVVDPTRWGAPDRTARIAGDREPDALLAEALGGKVVDAGAALREDHVALADQGGVVEHEAGQADGLAVASKHGKR